MSAIFGVGKKKDNSRRKGIPAMAKERRKAEALARQEAYAKLSLEQKLMKASRKERAKLLGRV